MSYQSRLEHRRKTQIEEGLYLDFKAESSLFVSLVFLMGSKKNIRRPGLMLKAEACRDTRWNIGVRGER